MTAVDSPTTPPGAVPGRGYSPEDRARALVEALPYSQRFRGAIVVVKMGGNAMGDDESARTFAERNVVSVAGEDGKGNISGRVTCSRQNVF